MPFSKKEFVGMKVKQLYTKCLAQGAYYIESKGEVAIIDPLREVQQYIDMADENNAKIKYIFETHFHADFVSGHLTLSNKTDAKIVFGPLANPDFEALIAKDEQEFKVGELTIRALHTPGHTMESTTYLLLNEQRKEVAIFTGDTLFIGDVGRPDLAQKSADITQEALAGKLYDSLRSKIMSLPDDVIIYPAHGAGSACGKNMSSETQDTLGNQKLTNYALRADISKEAFIKELTDGLLPPPAYFPENVRLNKSGYRDIDKVLQNGLQPLAVDDFITKTAQSDVLILDVRHQKDFVEGFIKNAYFVGLDGSFAPWVGAILKNINQKILLITPKGREEEAVTRLARVGFDNVIGYLEGGFEVWKMAGKPMEVIETEAATQALDATNNSNELILDVRKPGEYEAGHVNKAQSLPLDFLQERLAEFPDNVKVHVHCQSGYRSVIAASILKADGHNNLVNVDGGFNALKEKGAIINEAVAS